VAGLLESPQREQGNQVSGVQAGCGRVEAGIERERPIRRRGGERFAVGRLRDQAALVQFIEDASTHDVDLPL